ncbi:MAG: tetratricopeptide repeat protein, partial [Bacteroidales bacterium]|nr:tetratricopeptide repeat protein [Bacteroidales bacterium]
RLDSTDYWTFFFRGIAKYDLGDLRGSQKDFSTAVRLNPLFTDGYHYRAHAYNRTGEYEKALEDLRRAIELRPGFNALYHTRGLTWFFSRNFEKAVEDFDHYLRRDPDDPSAYTYRGDAWLHLGDTLKAMSDYDKALAKDRFYANGYLHRSELYAAQGRFEDAVHDMDKAIALDTASTYFYFHRGLLLGEMRNYKAAIADLDQVLDADPGNALTLYNRSLMYANVGEYEKALDDMDRVINVNPNNLLAHFNRAGYLINLGKWHEALDDYDTCIELYPDFAKAYMNRSYVKNRLGRKRESKKDYETAQRKVREYMEANASVEGTYADTTQRYNSFITFDADFARKDFSDELLQHRDIDIRLRPLYKFRIQSSRGPGTNALGYEYENALVNHFAAGIPVPVGISNADSLSAVKLGRSLDYLLAGDSSQGAGTIRLSPARTAFIHGLYELQNKQYNTALGWFDKAVAEADSDKDEDRYAPLYKAFYQMNRGVLKAEMIEFIASIESNTEILTVDESGTARSHRSEAPKRMYDWSEAISDMEAAKDILPDIPYIWFNLGNLYCLSSQMVSAISSFDKAISLHPYMGEAFFNRGLVLIFLRDKEKGCIDLSRAGELGIKDAYGVIDRYCRSDQE